MSSASALLIFFSFCGFELDGRCSFGEKTVAITIHTGTQLSIESFAKQVESGSRVANRLSLIGS